MRCAGCRRPAYACCTSAAVTERCSPSSARSVLVGRCRRRDLAVRGAHRVGPSPRRHGETYDGDRLPWPGRCLRRGSPLSRPRARRRSRRHPARGRRGPARSSSSRCRSSANVSAARQGKRAQAGEIGHLWRSRAATCGRSSVKPGCPAARRRRRRSGARRSGSSRTGPARAAPRTRSGSSSARCTSWGSGGGVPALHVAVRSALRAAMSRVDVLVVSLDATAGLREADEELVASMRMGGASVARVVAVHQPTVRTFALTRSPVGARGPAGDRRGPERAGDRRHELHGRAALATPRGRALPRTRRRQLSCAPRRLAGSGRAAAAGAGVPHRQRERAGARLGPPRPHASAVVVPVAVEPSGPSGPRDIAAVTYAADRRRRGSTACCRRGGRRARRRGAARRRDDA